MRVLVVEDESVLGEAVSAHLSLRGYAVDLVADLRSATAALDGADFDIVLLDINLPDGSGLAFLKGMRANQGKLPVLIISSRDQLSDRIGGLNIGADDYMTKPFHMDELVARVEAIRRRHSGSPNPVLEIGNISVDTANRHAVCDGKDVHLTAREWALLARLALRPGATLSKVQLEETLYHFGTAVDSNTVEVYISRLRRKFRPDFIETLRGVGYRLSSAR